MTTIFQDVDAENRLLELELTLNNLRDILKHISATISGQTEDHPGWGTGITVASEAVFAARSVLREEGWQSSEERGFALVRSPSERIAINIAKGDSGVANPAVEVCSVSEKGVCTASAVEWNQMSLPLEPVEAPLRQTWYLLYRKEGGVIYAELSLPTGMTDNKLALWEQRIMLPVVRDDSAVDPIIDDEQQGIEVRFEKRK